MMENQVAWGWAGGLVGKSAAQEAAQSALKMLTITPPVFGVVLVSYEVELQEVMAGITEMLPNIPLWGFSSYRLIASPQLHPRVVVGLFAGSGMTARPLWFPAYSQDSIGTALEFSRILQDSYAFNSVILAADGVKGNAAPICAAFEGGNLQIAGCLAGGDYHQAKTYQIGGRNSGSGALSALLLGGNLMLGAGTGHGWKEIGLHYTVTRSRDMWVQGLDGVSPAEIYSRVFQYPPREWAFPPLNDLVRLYPLGEEIYPGSEQLILHAPLHVEVDGSFRMNVPLAEGQVVRIMIGDAEACLDAARSAAKQAAQALNGAKPLVGMVLLDQAWQFMFESQPARVLETVQAELPGIPLVGAYTLGQISRLEPASLPVVFNQNIQVVLLGELPAAH